MLIHSSKVKKKKVKKKDLAYGMAVAREVGKVKVAFQLKQKLSSLS